MSAVALHVIKAMKFKVAESTIYPLFLIKQTVIILYMNPKILNKYLKI